VTRLRRRLLAAVVVLVVGPASTVEAAPPAPSQSPHVEVVSQTPFVPVEGDYEARLSWDGPVAGYGIGVRIFEVVSDEARLDRTPSGQLNRLEPIPLDQLPRDGDGRLVLRIPVRSLPLPHGDPQRVYLPGPGVYPLQFEVTGPDGNQVASAVSHLIRLPGETAEIEPVPVAVALRVGRSGGLTVAEAVELLERFPTTPMTVLVDHTAVGDAAIEEPDLVERFARAVEGHQIGAINPVALDVAALAEIGHLELFDRVRRDGAKRLEEHLGRPVDTDVALLGDLPTAAAADHLAAAGVRVLLGPTGTREGTLATIWGPITVLGPDEDLMQALGNPTANAYDALARLAVRFGAGDTRPVLFSIDRASGVTDTELSIVLTGLAQPGIMTPVPVAAVASRADRRLVPAERPRQDLRPTAALLEATLSDLDQYTAFYVNGPEPPSHLAEQVIAALATDVAPQRRTARLASVRADITRAFEVISLPEGRTVNLAATTSPLPLTLTSTAPGTRRVLIRFESDKLTFPFEAGGARLVDVEQGTSSFDFVVESRSIGVSPLDVVVSTPDGSRELARTRFTIRSTAVPGLGLLLSGAALVFLVGWWIVHATHRTRLDTLRPAGSDPVA
jgi:hypothetical protein